MESQVLVDVQFPPDDLWVKLPKGALGLSRQKLFAEDRFKIKRDQIVVWIGLEHAAGASEAAPIRRLPAILDTGCSTEIVMERVWFNFLSNGVKGANYGWKSLKTANGRIDAEAFGHFALRVFNNKFDTHVPAETPGTILHVREVAVYDNPGTTLPLLGMSLFSNKCNRLHLHIDGPGRRALLMQGGDLKLKVGEQVPWLR